MRVEADPEAVRFISERGGRLYVYASAAGLQHVSTEAPDDPSLRFEQLTADGFFFFVASDLVHPETWNLKLRRFPRQHIEVLWNGEQPGGPAVGSPGDAG